MRTIDLRRCIVYNALVLHNKHMTDVWQNVSWITHYVHVKTEWTMQHGNSQLDRLYLWLDEF